MLNLYEIEPGIGKTTRPFVDLPIVTGLNDVRMRWRKADMEGVLWKELT